MTFIPDFKKPPREKKERKPLNRMRASKGEYEIFTQIHKELGGKSQITGKYLPFDIKNFAHIISKGARPDLRLNKENILHVEYLFHWFYDNRSKEDTLQKFPGTEWVYTLKEKLKSIPVIKK